ncbi:MAG: sigma-70 family RNA polymerase sigma factor, partial [Selenomonadaceae bacterium]|nr:sigma-70 family RNA polymerase sigma factor [Selenomonadaceae bacterium]
ENFDPVAPETETPERQMLSKEENEKIRRAMMQLTERQQKIVEMTYWLDMKSPEIAKILGIEPDTVRATLRQARAKLKKLLEN